MNRPPFFSIITVTYNAGKDLQETIKSVRNQTFRDYEYIIIDGGSEDGTKEIIETNKQGIDKWISEADRGIYDAMNKGMRMAKGEYIYFLNAGDRLAGKDVLSKVREHTLTKNEVLLYGDIIATRNGTETVRISRKVTPVSLKLGKKLIHQSIFLRTIILKAANGFDLKYKLSADFDLLCRLSLMGTEMTHIPINIASFDLSGASSDIRASYRENLLIIAENFGKLWALLYKITSFVKLTLITILIKVLGESEADRFRKFSQ